MLLKKYVEYIKAMAYNGIVFLANCVYIKAIIGIYFLIDIEYTVINEST